MIRMGEVYFDQPPVMHLLGAVLMRASEGSNLFHARFPSALAALISWAGPAYARDGGDYLRGVLFQEDLSTGGGSGHFEPFYWYLGSGFLQTLPVSLFLPHAIQQWRREREFPAALAIAGVILFVLSCVPGKRRHYLLPVLPFLAIGLATGIAYYARNHRLLRRLALTTVLGGILAGPLYYGPILHGLRPRGDSEWVFVTDVAEALPPSSTVGCFGAMGELLAWVERDHRRINRSPIPVFTKQHSAMTLIHILF